MKKLSKFYFNISISNTEISVKAKDSEGNNLNASATNIIGEQKDNLLSGLVESGFIETTDDVNALISVESDDFDGIAETTFDVSNIAKEGNTVVILHFDKEKQQWEYVSIETVDSEGKIIGDFTSYSPVAFIIVVEDGSFETHTGIATTKAECFKGKATTENCKGSIKYTNTTTVSLSCCGEDMNLHIYIC